MLIINGRVTNKETSHEIFFLTKLKGCNGKLFLFFIVNCVPRLHAYGEE